MKEEASSYLKDKIIRTLIYFKCAMMLLFSETSQANNKGEYQLYYQITPSIEESNHLDIKSSIQTKRDIFFIDVPRFVKKLRLITDIDEKVKVTLTNEKSVFKVSRSQKTSVFLSYQSCVKNADRDIFYPIVEKDFFYFPMGALLITPTKSEEKSLINVQLNFPSHLFIATNFNLNQREYQVYEKLTDFRESLVAIGKLKIDKFTIKGKPVHVISNHEWRSFKKPISFYIEKMLSEQRAFWKDNDFPLYSIFLINQLNPRLPKSFVGSHFHQSFSAVFPDLADTFPIVMWGLSHELFHAWLGKKITIETNDPLLWLREGFTNYYAGLFALKSGAINVKEYIEIYNNFIKIYVASPFYDATNQEIMTYSGFNNYYLISLAKGHFLARMLRETDGSAGRKSFDATVKAFRVPSKNIKKHFTKEQANNAFKSHYINYSKWLQADDIMEQGKPLVFSSSAFYPFAKLVNIATEVPDFGFDIKILIKENTIQKLFRDSNAYRAGLREGQKVLRHSIDPIKIKEANIYIYEDGKEKLIAFMPETIKKMIPQYQLTKNTLFSRGHG